MGRIAVRLLIEGRVQGVWYRAWTVRRARALELHGWVRNCRDGRVEALLSGEKEVVEQMIEACAQGSPAASVTAVRRFSLALEEDLPFPFEQRPTA